MKISKFLLISLVLTLIMSSLMGCTPKASPSTNPGEKQPDSIKQISIGGAGTSGTFYIMAAGFADVIGKELGINSVAEVTGGSVENVKLIGTNKIEMGVSQVDVAQNALKGTNQFDKPIELTAVLPMYPNVVQIVTLKNSPINEFSDLKGKKVSVGSPGSGILATNETILKTLGLTMDDIVPQYLSFSETTDAFRDGSIDAAIVNTAAPAPWVVDLETTHPIKLIALTPEEIGKFTTPFPYYVDAIIEKEAYKSLENDVPTFAVWIALVSQANLPDDVVYNVVKSIFENGEHLKDIHVASKYITLDNVKNISGITFHPGAVKYFKEKGIELPAN